MRHIPILINPCLLPTVTMQERPLTPRDSVPMTMISIGSCLAGQEA
jgi:hypothetical protein